VAGKIIIAEDNDDTREALRLSLEAEGYAVRAAANGDEAFRLQASDPADVLVTDLVMPERDGFETLMLFRQNFPRVRIVVVSGSATRLRGNYLEAAQMVGADATLRKPVAPADLTKLIADVLERA
jgi:CheY-like chemotaxis protein